MKQEPLSFYVSCINVSVWPLKFYFILFWGQSVLLFVIITITGISFPPSPEPVYIFTVCLSVHVRTAALCDRLISPRQCVCSLSAGPVWYLNTAVWKEVCVLCICACGICSVHVKLNEGESSNISVCHGGTCTHLRWLTEVPQHGASWCAGRHWRICKECKRAQKHWHARRSQAATQLSVSLGQWASQ